MRCYRKYDYMGVEMKLEFQKMGWIGLFIGSNFLRFDISTAVLIFATHDWGAQQLAYSHCSKILLRETRFAVLSIFLRRPSDTA